MSQCEDRIIKDPGNGIRPKAIKNYQIT